MMLAHKIELVPAPAQEIYFRKACGTARFAYNWGLARWNELRAAGETPNALALKNELNAIKGERFPWMYDVTKCAPEAALADLGSAFANYFRDLRRRGGRRAKRPTFKKKGRCRDSFYVSNDQFVIEGRQIRLPHIVLMSALFALTVSQRQCRGQGVVDGNAIGKALDRSVEGAVMAPSWHLGAQIASRAAGSAGSGDPSGFWRL